MFDPDIMKYIVDKSIFYVDFLTSDFERFIRLETDDPLYMYHIFSLRPIFKYNVQWFKRYLSCLKRLAQMVIDGSIYNERIILHLCHLPKFQFSQLSFMVKTTLITVCNFVNKFHVTLYYMRGIDYSCEYEYKYYLYKYGKKSEHSNQILLQELQNIKKVSLFAPFSYKLCEKKVDYIFNKEYKTLIDIFRDFKLLDLSVYQNTFFSLLETYRKFHNVDIEDFKGISYEKLIPTFF